MRRALVLSILAALALMVPATGVQAGGQEEPAALRAEVDPGLDGFYVPALPVPVRVTLTATELTSGQLQVRADGATVEVIDVEVTAGSSEDHWVLLDTSQGDSVQVFATVVVEGKRLPSDSAVVQSDRDVHLVGVLPSLGAGRVGDEIPLQLMGQDLHFIDLEPALLDLGPSALAALDSVAVTPDDIATLSDLHRETLLGWLTAGGTLYVDGPAGPLIDWPDELQPGAAASGLSRVIATDGALAAGRWAEVVVPAPNRSIQEDAEASQNIAWPDLFLEFSGIDLGRDLPPLSRLLAGLGIYVLLVGPIIYLVSKRRVMVRWIAIPAVAMLATAGLAASSDGLGDDTAVSVVDVIETGPGTAIATSRLLVASDQGGRQIAAPPGWAAENDDFIGFGAEITQRRTATGVNISVPAPAGGVGYLAARGPVAFEGQLEIRAVATDDGVVRGEVTNTTTHDLTDVAVFSGRNTGAPVGALAAGQSVEFELSGTDQFRFAPRTFQEVWASSTAGGGGGVNVTTTMPMPFPPEEMGEIVSESCDEFGNCEQCDANGNCFGIAVDPMVCDEFGNCFPQGQFPGCGDPSGCRDRNPRTESLTAALWDRGTNVMAPGMITAIGWSDDIAPQVDLGSGVQVVERRTAVVSRAAPMTTGDRLVDSGVVRTIAAVRNDQNGIEIVFRFDLPATVGDRAVDPARLRLDVPELFHRVAILTSAAGAPGGEVLLRDLRVDQAVPPGRLEAPLPPGALFTNSVFVKVALPFEPPRPGRELVMYEVAA